MRCYWLCLLLLAPCNWAEETKISIKNDGYHEWSLHVSSNANEKDQQPVKDIYLVPPRTRLGVPLEAYSISSIDIKMERNDGAFWFEGRVTKKELFSHECITPTSFKYSRQPFPIRVEICNNTIYLIPVGTVVNICIDNRTPDKWRLWNVVQGDTLQSQTFDGGARRCQLIQQYHSGGIFYIKLERVNYPWASVYFPGFSQYDEQPACKSPYFSNYTVDHSFRARYCNDTMILTTLNQQDSKLDGFCIENQAHQQLFHDFSHQNGDFSLSFTEGFSPFSTSSQAGACFRLYGYHDRNVTFNINATYESAVVKGQFIRVSEALSDCTLPGTLVHTWENPPVEWYQCGNKLTIFSINHTFCIENASPDSWTVTGTLEKSADNWYKGRDPASVIASKVVDSHSKACYVLNKRHNGEVPFGLILERLDGKSLTLRVRHTRPENEERWGASKLLVDSTWEEEIPYKLELYKNTLFLGSALDMKVFHSRRRRAHFLDTSLPYGCGNQCLKEGELRLISGSRDQHEECDQGKWVTRMNPEGMVMVVEDGTLVLRSLEKNGLDPALEQVLDESAPKQSPIRTDRIGSHRGRSDRIGLGPRQLSIGSADTMVHQIGSD